MTTIARNAQVLVLSAFVATLSTACGAPSATESADPSTSTAGEVRPEAVAGTGSAAATPAASASLAPFCRAALDACIEGAELGLLHCEQQCGLWPYYPLNGELFAPYCYSCYYGFELAVQACYAQYERCSLPIFPADSTMSTTSQ